MTKPLIAPPSRQESRTFHLRDLIPRVCEARRGGAPDRLASLSSWYRARRLRLTTQPTKLPAIGGSWGCVWLSNRQIGWTRRKRMPWSTLLNALPPYHQVPNVSGTAPDFFQRIIFPPTSSTCGQQRIKSRNTFGSRIRLQVPIDANAKTCTRKAAAALFKSAISVLVTVKLALHMYLRHLLAGRGEQNIETIRF
jgi:hypothetical protein